MLTLSAQSHVWPHNDLVFVTPVRKFFLVFSFLFYLVCARRLCVHTVHLRVVFLRVKLDKTTAIAIAHYTRPPQLLTDSSGVLQRSHVYHAPLNLYSFLHPKIFRS